jgi:diguanylate cyclase (GGDEF)-like protein
MLPAAATDLRSLVEQYVYPIVVCDEDGGVRFCNVPAQTLFGGVDLVGRALPAEWMDKDMIELEINNVPTVFRMLWAEIMWEGNPAWYLLTYPAEGGESEELKARLEQSLEMAAVEAEKRQQMESDRERLEAKLRDLHQRSVSKLEAARAALETEKAERQSLFERLSRLRDETDTLRAQLDEKKLELEEVSHRSSEAFESLKAELTARERALANAEEKSERYRQVYEELDAEMTRSQEQSALLSARLRTAESRLDRAQRLLDGGSLDAINALGSGAEESEVLALREKVVELESELRRARLEPPAPARDPEAEARIVALESECQALRQQLEQASSSSATEAGLSGEIEALRRQLEDSRAVVAELRLRGQQELWEARAAVRKLQDLCRALKDGREAPELEPATEADGTVMEELDAARSRVLELEQALEAAGDQILALSSGSELPSGSAGDVALEESQRQVAALTERVAELEERLGKGEETASVVEPEGSTVSEQALWEAQARIAELEQQLAQAQESSSTIAVGQEAHPAERALLEASQRVAELEAELARAQSGSGLTLDTSGWQQRIAELEAQLERAQSEASPQELIYARNRISELELMVAQAGGSAGGASDPERMRLENELAQAHSQLNEMARELRRTMDGDRETKKLAYADQLTGLPNYNLTGQYLQVCFERSSRGEGALALILIDLDNFRRVNDALGSKSGDELLRQVGARLQRTVTEKDTAIARRGEDEFLVVAFLEGATVDGEALSARVRGIAHNLLSELIKPFEIVDQRVQITASMGVALYPGPAIDREALLEQAEHAMYKAKESGRARVSFYTQEIHLTRDRKIRVERELRQAVNDGQFTMLYQPILEIPSGKIVGLEALLRWSHPQRGLLEPSEFLGVAEEIGVILPLSDQVMAEALVVCKQKFMKRRFMSFNLSHRQLVDASFPSRFMKQLERAQVKPSEVMVEVSERTTRMDPERSRNTLAALAQWGVGIALDDFGSGSSELSMFREFPVKLVKIDGSLVSKLPGDRDAVKLCMAISKMAAAMEIPVLAEGVESREQLEMISTLGCQYAQGMFLREPMNVNQLVQIL